MDGMLDWDEFHKLARIKENYDEAMGYFKQYDWDGDGTLDQKEWHKAYRDKDPNVDKATIQEHMEIGDTNKDERLDMNEFLALIWEDLENPKGEGVDVSEWTEKEWRAAYQKGDLNSDGFAQWDEFLAVYNYMFPDTDKEQIEYEFQEFDENMDG